MRRCAVLARGRRSDDLSVTAEIAVATAGGVATERGATAAVVARERLRVRAFARDASASSAVTESGETGAEGAERRQKRARDSVPDTLKRAVESWPKAMSTPEPTSVSTICAEEATRGPEATWLAEGGICVVRGLL